MAKEKTLPIVHVNARLSISFLLLKLILLDIFAALFIIFYSSFLYGQAIGGYELQLLSFHTVFFVLIGFLKIFFTIFIILQWLNEYYEITPTMVIYKRGMIYRKVDKYSLDHIRSVGIYQGIVGKMLNYGTITLFDWDLNAYRTLYQIHNPMKYTKLIESLLPEVEEEKHTLRRHLSTEEEDEN